MTSENKNNYFNFPDILLVLIYGKEKVKINYVECETTTKKTVQVYEYYYSI